MTGMIILLVPLLILAVLIPKLRRYIKINRWKKQLKLTQHFPVYQHLYHQLNGFALSRQARVFGDAIEYLYGEIEFLSFIALLSLTKPNRQTVFYDLGSGTGKAVIACAMVFPVQKSCGVELFQLLHQAAESRKIMLAECPDYCETAKTISFIHGDFLTCSWRDATLVFINATALIGETWKQLNQKLQQLAAGTIVITTTKTLCAGDAFELIYTTRVEMSWGRVNAYIQKRGLIVNPG